jgi:restriction system protein
MARRTESASKKARAAADHTARVRYVAEREKDVATLNHELDERVAALEQLLRSPDRLTAQTPARRELCFEALRLTCTRTPFNAESIVGARPIPPNRTDYTTAVPVPTAVGQLFGGRAKYERALAAARLHDDAVFATARDAFEANRATWIVRAEQARVAADQAHAEQATTVDEHHAHVSLAESTLANGDPEAIVAYAASVLEATDWPDDIPNSVKVAMVSDSRQLVVEMVLPLIELVPAVREYSYAKSKDDVKEKPRPKAEVLSLYRTVVAGMVQRRASGCARASFRCV